MIDYLYDPKFWELDWTLLSISRKVLILPILVALFIGSFKHPVHKKIIFFAGFSLIMEHCSRDADIKNLFHPDTNSPWYHLLTPLLFLLMTRFFSDYLDTGKNKIWPLVPFMLILLVTLYGGFLGPGFYVFPSVLIGLYSFFGILLSVGYFLYLLRSLNDYYIERNPMFWVSSGLLIYFAGNFLLWVGLNFLTYDRVFFSSIYQINSIVTILLYLFFTVAICLNPEIKTKT